MYGLRLRPDSGQKQAIFQGSIVSCVALRPDLWRVASDLGALRWGALAERWCPVHDLTRGIRQGLGIAGSRTQRDATRPPIATVDVTGIGR